MKISDDILIEAVGNLLKKENQEECSEEEIKIVSQEWSSGSTIGEDNYMCLLSQVKVGAEVRGKLRLIDLIVKHPPELESMVQFLKTTGACDKELHSYQKLLPEIQRLWLTGPGTRPPFPDCYYANPDNLTIIMSNLKTMGYKMVDKKGGLDMRHLRAVFKELARFHAVGYHMIQNLGEEKFVEDHSPICKIKGWINFDDENSNKIYNIVFNNVKMIFQEVVNTEESLHLASKIEGLIQRGVHESIVEYLAGPKEDTFKVVAHADCWSNNIMFKEKESMGEDMWNHGNDLDVRFVDLQLMRYGPPCVDIWYILTSATTLGWRQEHLEEATEFYYDHLYASLDKLGYSPDKVFPMEAFKRQLDHCYGVGYICGNLLVMPIHQFSDDKMFDLERDAKEGHLPDFEERKKKRIIEGCKRNPTVPDRYLQLAREALERGVL